MARLARVVVPGMPHHVTQRGNRRMQTFFGDEDYRAYLSLMVEWCGRHGVAIWTYCLMPNHVHLILVPPGEDAPARAVGEAHRRYTRRVNFREGWRGHLWQERFASFGNRGTGYVFLLTACGGVGRVGVMARLARVVVPGMPHHVTQRGNRRMQTFFGDEDYREIGGQDMYFS